MRRIAGAAAVCLALAFAVLWWAVYAGATMPLDNAVTAAFGPDRVGKLVYAGAAWVTLLGPGATGFAVSLAATALLWSSGRLRLAAWLWITFLGAEATAWAVKFLSARARPDIRTITEMSPSFPSAHATVAVAVYGFVAFAAARSLPDPARRVVIGGAALLVLLIGASRVVLSVHFLSDVLGGYLVGGTWLLAAIALLSPAYGRNPPDRVTRGP